ncbi:MAG: 4Fe-4S dicluster domain-containing protein [Clostridiales Family XIII bacterium]|nr:4Fe-4S dicluster domain-containing protein [Clostridiales Family XIII bacterium]
MIREPQDIQRIEERCLGLHAPFCEAGCPFHVEAREMLAAVSAGDMAAAFGFLAKAAPFPLILGSLCAHPCEGVCRLSEACGGVAVRISEVERAVVRAALAAAEAEEAGGALLRERVGRLPPKARRAAVIGAGLAGMTAALLLVRRGYPVDLYEKADCVGGRLVGAAGLPTGALAWETRRLDAWANLLQIHLRSEVGGPGGPSFEEISEAHDAVFVACGLPMAGVPELPELPGGADAGSGAGGAGGAASGEGLDALSAMHYGQAAAIGIDRFLQGADMLSGRAREGAYASELYTNLEGVRPSAPVEAAGGGYTPEEAASEAARCIGCRCGECAKHCPYLAETGQLPGELVRSISKNLIIMPGMGARLATKLINSCNLCGLCKEVCPAGIDMAEVNLAARGILWEKGYLPATLHELPLRDLAFSNSAEFLFCAHAPGHEGSAYAFFPGCQLPASLPGTVRRCWDFLRGQGDGRCGIFLGCCGAPALWAGRRDEAEKQFALLVDNWEALGRPVLLTACPGCHKVLAEHVPQIPLRYLPEALAEGALPGAGAAGEVSAAGAAAAPFAGRAFALHDACTMRHDGAMQEAFRALAVRAGVDAREFRYSRRLTRCCGFGGLQDYIAPETGEAVASDRLAETDLPILTACSNCRDIFAGRGRESRHVLEAVFGPEAGSPAADGMPDYDTRRANRRALRAAFEVLCGATPASALPPLDLEIPVAVAERMRLGGVLRDEVEAVIRSAQADSTGFALEGGRTLAGGEVGLITCWALYREVAPGRYLLEDAYAHRMRLVPAGPGAPAGAPPSGEDAAGQGATCRRDGAALTLRKREVEYLGSKYQADLPACPLCGQTLVSKETAAGKMREIEKMLEEK